MKIELPKPSFKQGTVPIQKQMEDYLTNLVNTLNVLLGEIDTDNLSANLINKLGSGGSGISANEDEILMRVEDVEQGTASEISVMQGQLSLKVSKGDVVNQLDSEMSSIDITPNQIAFNSTGSLVIDTTNLKLKADGTATFSGTVEVSGTQGTTTISNGYLVQGSGNNNVTIANGLILVNKNGTVKDLSNAVMPGDLASASVNYATTAGHSNTSNFADLAGSTNMLGTSVNSAIYDVTTNSLNPAMPGTGHLGQISTPWQSVAVSGSVYIDGQRLTAADVQKLHNL